MYYKPRQELLDLIKDLKADNKKLKQEVSILKDYKYRLNTANRKLREANKKVIKLEQYLEKLHKL